MPEASFIAVTLGAGLLCGGGVLVAAGGARPIAAFAAARRSSPVSIARALATRSRAGLVRDLDRAGWSESPERLVALAVAFATGLAVVGASTASTLTHDAAVVVCCGGIAFGLALPVFALRSAIARRRRRLEGELVPVLELFTLELSGGGSPVAALGSVTVQVQGELAADLRRMLIASQVAGTASFESRLVEYSEHVQIPAIGTLATILAASRDYGTGVVQGVRALATDLRRAQRRELIAHSRRALNHVLFPTAVGVLLPFLAILMFPAIAALHGNLR